ncbi:MAG: VOC family protein [Solirubrobacterales bacterium]
MGQPVVHFEVVGTDGDKLKAYYADLFGWEFEEAPGPMNYGVVQREGSTNADGIGIGGGVGGVPGDAGHVTFYVEVPDIDAALAKAESLGGKRLMGPDEVPGTGTVIAHIGDPEGHVIGLVNATT